MTTPPAEPEPRDQAPRPPVGSNPAEETLILRKSPQNAVDAPGADSGPGSSADSPPDERDTPSPRRASPADGVGEPPEAERPVPTAGYPKSGSAWSTEPGGTYGTGEYSNANVTSVYSQSPPSYAPAGYPAEYSPAAAAPARSAPAPAVPTTGSRVTAGLLSAVLGLLLVAGGVFLAAKYGVAATRRLDAVGTIGVKETILAFVGALLLLAAVVLNGWSYWATLLPGVALIGLGGWAFFNTVGLDQLTRWTNWWTGNGEFRTWHSAGFTLLLGLVLLAASIAAALARSAGRRFGAAQATAAALDRHR